MAAALETAFQKQARIKTGVLTRIEKELAGYHEELAKQREKVDGMRSSGADEHDVKKQTEVLEETEMMIPDTLRRLAAAVDDLRAFLETHGADETLAGSSQLAAANAALARHAEGGVAVATAGGATGGAASGTGAEDEAI